MTTAGCLACTDEPPLQGKPWCSKRCRAALRAWGRQDYPSLPASEQLALVIGRAEQARALGRAAHERVAAFLSAHARTVPLHHEHAGRTEATEQGPTHPTRLDARSEATEASPALGTASAVSL